MLSLALLLSCFVAPGQEGGGSHDLVPWFVTAPDPSQRDDLWFRWALEVEGKRAPVAVVHTELAETIEPRPAPANAYLTSLRTYSVRAAVANAGTSRTLDTTDFADGPDNPLWASFAAWRGTTWEGEVAPSEGAFSTRMLTRLEVGVPRASESEDREASALREALVELARTVPDVIGARYATLPTEPKDGTKGWKGERRWFASRFGRLLATPEFHIVEAKRLKSERLADRSFDALAETGAATLPGFAHDPALYTVLEWTFDEFAQPLDENGEVLPDALGELEPSPRKCKGSGIGVFDLDERRLVWSREEVTFAAKRSSDPDVTVIVQFDTPAASGD